MSMRIYTSEQVHRIVEQVLLALDSTEAPEAEQTHLDNDISQNTSPENTNVTLTVAEAAHLVRISKPKMYEIVRCGKVRSVKIGKKILISRQSLLDWIRKGDLSYEKTC